MMLHGGGHTGACWQVTADGRPGWAYRFAARGYDVIVPDWPGHGRSGAQDSDTLSAEFVCQGFTDLISGLDTPVTLITHSMSGAFGWRIAELAGDRVPTVIGVAPSAPGDIQAVARNPVGNRR